MFTLMELVQPETIEDAYKALTAKKTNAVVAGCGFLRMGKKRIGTAVQLSKLDLDYVKEDDEYFEIGAMTTFRTLEVHEGLNKQFNGLLEKAVGNIIGIQFRNVVTVGATVYSRYGFSDLITGLLTLDTEVELYNQGRMTLDKWLDRPYEKCEKDLLTKIFIKKNPRIAVYKDMRNEISDYPVLNLGVSLLEGQWKIVVGARPAVATEAKTASAFLSENQVNETIAIKAAEMAAEELSFGPNMRASAEYRKNVCKILVKRAIMEVLSCHK
ncbi:FAD binding domain-containing protein [Clostridium hydrogeniformans]|uniref:FAD binding domain-containing protein n=1 Tax=Clostridium hydrogeniformans TaxID=349933 RepID=UPI0004881214|nr:FAD binding domain-containing protein [Clostridium hydrogeniformans]